MTQGICERDDLPEAFVKWADSQGYGPVQAITWYADDDVMAHFPDTEKRIARAGSGGLKPNAG